MTKKSSARLMRDAEQKQSKNYLGTNKCWDELNSMYVSMTQLLGQHTNLKVFGSNVELVAMVADKETLATNFKILANDLQTMSTELTQIHNQHANKSGGEPDPNALMESITIFEQYHLFMGRHDAVVMPTVDHIIEQLDAAERKLIEVGKIAADLTNPAVISDVAYTETQALHPSDITGVTHHLLNNPPDFNKLAKSFNAIHTEPAPVVLVDKEVLQNVAQ